MGLAFARGGIFFVILRVWWIGEAYKAVQALRLMTERGEQGWRMGLRRADARTILASALRSSDDSAEHGAIYLINYLAARNDRQIVDLTSKSE